MTVPTDPYTFVNGVTADAPQVNARFAPLYAALNGSLAADNLGALLQAAIFTPGDLKATARSVAPAGWMMCDGSPVARGGATAALFAAIGTAYGNGDGSTTFNLPDLRARAPIGVDGTAGRLSASNALGNAGGSSAHTLGVNEIPAHQHQYASATIVATVNAGTTVNVAGAALAATTFAGGGGAHNNMAPYQVVNWMVKL